jgi:hypothetical protein
MSSYSLTPLFILSPAYLISASDITTVDDKVRFLVNAMKLIEKMYRDKRTL